MIAISTVQILHLGKCQELLTVTIMFISDVFALPWLKLVQESIARLLH